LNQVVSQTPVHGTVDPGFEAVREVFERTVEGKEVGAGVSAYLDGRRVVDLWGGWADAAKTREWKRDTIACTYSSVKGMTATCAHKLVDRGLLDVDEPVAAYWPEFAQAGKENVTVRMVLSHQSGLPWATAPYPPDKRFDWDTVTDALARSAPLWEPGTKSAYHGGSFGYLVGEVLRRIDGRTLGAFFREEIGEPLGADYLVAFGPQDDDRCAEMIGTPDDVGNTHTREWRSAGDGAATAFGTADGLARVYAALARGGELDGVEVLRPRTIEAAVQEQVPTGGANYDEMAPVGLGYMLLWKMFPVVEYTGMFGHTGMGGSVGFADPFNRVGFGWVMNRLHGGGVFDVQAAVYRCIVEQRARSS
jgi:CubicO group peptidase (beta-lactamase class C family)